MRQKASAARSPAPSAAAGESAPAAAAGALSIEVLGAQLLEALPTRRLRSVSIWDTQGNTLWLNEGSLGPDEHGLIAEAQELFSGNSSLASNRIPFDDGGVGLFLAIRAPTTDLIGIAMILADTKSIGEDMAKTPAVRQILVGLSVLIKPGSGARTGATGAFPQLDIAAFENAAAPGAAPTESAAPALGVTGRFRALDPAAAASASAPARAPVPAAPAPSPPRTPEPATPPPSTARAPGPPPANAPPAPRATGRFRALDPAALATVANPVARGAEPAAPPRTNRTAPAPTPARAPEAPTPPPSKARAPERAAANPAPAPGATGRFRTLDSAALAAAAAHRTAAAPNTSRTSDPAPAGGVQRTAAAPTTARVSDTAPAGGSPNLASPGTFRALDPSTVGGTPSPDLTATFPTIELSALDLKAAAAAPANRSTAETDKFPALDFDALSGGSSTAATTDQLPALDVPESASGATTDALAMLDLEAAAKTVAPKTTAPKAKAASPAVTLPKGAPRVLPPAAAPPTVSPRPAAAPAAPPKGAPRVVPPGAAPPRGPVKTPAPPPPVPQARAAPPPAPKPPPPRPPPAPRPSAKAPGTGSTGRSARIISGKEIDAILALEVKSDKADKAKKFGLKKHDTTIIDMLSLEYMPDATGTSQTLSRSVQGLTPPGQAPAPPAPRAPQASAPAAPPARTPASQPGSSAATTSRLPGLSPTYKPPPAVAALAASPLEESSAASASDSNAILEVLPYAKLRGGGQSRRLELLARSPQRETAAYDALVVQRLLEWLSANRPVWTTQPTSFTLNLSVASLEDDRFMQKIATAFNTHGIGAETLGFEIAEPLCTQRRNEVERFVTQCEKIGSWVVLDQFTLDSQVLPILRSKALRLVKIDPKLTSTALKDKLSQALVVATVQAAKVMGVNCSAKKVDSQAALQWLTAIGCDYAQGLAIAGPLSLQSIARL